MRIRRCNSSISCCCGIIIIVLYLSNPKPQSGRDGAAHCGTAGRGGDKQDRTSTGLFAQEIIVPPTLQTIEKDPSGRAPESKNRKSFM